MLANRWTANSSVRGRYTISAQRAKPGDDVIEAIECVKSWAWEGLVYGAGSQIQKVDAMLVDLPEHAAELAA
jgi:hypothetical protein